MSHALALWPGPLPADAAAACREYSSRMISHGIAWRRSRAVPDKDPEVMTFCRLATELLKPTLSSPTSRWRVPSEIGTIWGEMLTIELNGPQPAALAQLATLAEDHALVLFDIHAHRLLTPADITRTFGAPMISVPAQIPVIDLIGRCGERWDCIDELRVLSSDLLDCSQPLDPFVVTPVQDELETFRRVADELGCIDLEDLRDRLEDLIWAGEDLRARR
ncbi:hypothetical protein H3H54_10485 [Brachybacterium sp. Z12]|uniref:hypothetical protein n=1 Tax=Brachybacterium sp. Z12 TaxID=2759167 RepID=UPI00186206FD|nr:hypothetical protein [Brachybacterium sp. Z12]QNN81810.1 hypothetical protein H3H54_10485 [Brachybacterium sp. Z12]